MEYGLSGAGRALLVIHGAGGGFDQGLEFGRPLARSGFKVVAPSRFGYLKTPLPPDPSPAAQADAYVCLLDALGLQRVAVLGGSAGAPSAIAFCRRHAERCSALILLVPAIFVSRGTALTPKPSKSAQLVIRTTLRSDFVFWLASHVAPDTMIESILATPIEDFNKASAAEQQRVLNILRDILPVSPRASGLWTDATITTAPARYDFARIKAPTLILSSRNDLFGTLEGSRTAGEEIPAARLIVYPDGGHVWVGHQAEVWSAVERFLVARQG